MKLLFIFMLSLSTLFSSPNSFKLQVNDVNLLLDFKTNIASKTKVKDELNIGFSYLYVDEEKVILNRGESIDKYFNVYFEMEEDFDNGIEVGIGWKIVYSNLEVSNQDYLAIPLYLNLNYEINRNGIPPIILKSQFVYGPKALSFRDAKSYYELNFGIDVELIKNASLIISYKYINMEYSNFEINTNNNLYAGIEFKF